MYYRFHQNNSRGTYAEPAKVIIIEADNSEEAEARFLSINGTYFDYKYEIDCQCCGTRWDSGIEIDDEEELNRYINPSEDNWVTFDPHIPRLMVVYKDKNPLIIQDKQDTKAFLKNVKVEIKV
jgi:hypothetical protein